MSNQVSCLCEKIRQELNIEVDANTFGRTYAGRNQKAAGAFIWTIDSKYNTYGSCYPLSECIKNKNKLVLLVDGREIIPEEKNDGNNS